MGSQEGPMESTEDAAIAHEQPIAGKTKVHTLANGDIKAADESLVGASLDDAITSPIEKHDIHAGKNSILDEQIGTVAAKDPIMLVEVVRNADLESNTSQKEIQIFEGKDSNEGIGEDFGKQAGDSTSIGMEQQGTHEAEQVEEDCVREPAITDIDRVGSTIAEDSSHVQEGLGEEKPHKSSLLVEDKVYALDNTGVEEATGLNEENLLQEFSSREDRADEEVKNTDSAGALIMDKGDEPTITSIDQDDESSEQVNVQEGPILVEDEIPREPTAQELALPRQDEIVHEAPDAEDGLTTSDEKPTGEVVDDSLAPLAPADGIEESANGIDESNVCVTPSTVVKEEVTSPSTEFEKIPKEEVARHVEVETNSNEVSDSLPAQGEILEEAPTLADVADVSPTPAIGFEGPVAVKGEDCNVDESTKFTEGVVEAPTKEWESKGVVDVLDTPLTLVKDPTLENDVDEPLPFEEPAHVVGNDNSRSLPMQDEVVEEAPTAALVNNVKDVSPTLVEEEPMVGGEEEDVAPKVDVESTKDVQRADETPTAPVEVEESTDVVDESNVPPPIEEVIPTSTQFEGEPELAKPIDSTEDFVEPVPLEEHADDVKNNSSQLSDSLPTEDEIVEEVPTGDNVTTAEDVSSTPADGREEAFAALKGDDSTEGVDEEPVEVHESNVVKDAAELTEFNTEDELVEVNTEDDVKSREAPVPLEEPTHVVKNDSNEDVSPTPLEEEPIVGGEEEYVARKVEDCDLGSTKDVQGADEAPTSPVAVEESTDVVGTPRIVAKEEAIPESSQSEGEQPELIDVEVSTENSVESTEAPAPLEDHVQDVTNNSSQVSDSLPTQDEIVEEVPTGSTAEEVSSTPVDEEPIAGREEEFAALKADDCDVDESTKHTEEVHEEPHESKDESTVVKDELTEVGLVEGNTDDDVKPREAALPLEEPVKNDSNEVLGTLPMQDEIVEEDGTILLVEDVVVEAEPVVGGEKESLAPNEIDESSKHTGGVDEAPAEVEEPKDVADESTVVEAEVTPSLEDDVESREATVPAQVSQNISNEDSSSLPAHDEIVEEAPSVEDVSPAPPAQEEEPAATRRAEDSEVKELAQGVETPVESTDVADGLEAVEEKVILASNQFEGEFRELSEDPAQPTHDAIVEEAPTISSIGPTAAEEESSVEDCNVTKHPDEAPPARRESKDVVDESNAPVVEEESKEVVDKSNATETPVVKEESKEEVAHESNATEAPVVEGESKEVVEEPNAIETPSAVTEEEVSSASTQFEGEPEVAEDDVDSKGEGEVKEAPTLPLVTSSEEVTSTEEGPVCRNEEEFVASNIGESEVDESTKHRQEVVEALPVATEVEESKDVVDAPTSTESEGAPGAVAKSMEDTTETLPLEEPTQGSSNEVLATQDEAVEEVPATPITKAEDVEEESIVGGDEEFRELEVEDSEDADESRKHTEGVEDRLPTSNEMDESKDVVDDLETSLTVVEESTSTPVEAEPVDGGAEKSLALKVDESTKHTERVDETPTEVEAGDEVPLAPSDDHVGGGEEQVAEGDNDVDQLVENAAQEVDEDVVDDSNLIDAPSTTVEDEVTPTYAKPEGESLEQDVVESREIPMKGSVGNNSIEESSALSGQGEVVEEAEPPRNPPVTSTLVEEELASGGEEEPTAAIEADEAPSTLEETRDSDLEAPSTTVLKDEVAPSSDEEPMAPEAEDVMEDARESLEDEPTQVVENSSSLPRSEEVVEEAPAADGPLASVKDISPTQVQQMPKAEDQLPRELNVQLEDGGVGSSSEFEAEPQKATTNGVPQHDDVGDLSEEETEPKEASMNGWSANGGLVASALRTIVTTTMDMVKTTKPSKKKRMKLKKVLEAKKMQQV